MMSNHTLLLKYLCPELSKFPPTFLSCLSFPKFRPTNKQSAPFEKKKSCLYRNLIGIDLFCEFSKKSSL